MLHLLSRRLGFALLVTVSLAASRHVAAQAMRVDNQSEIVRPNGLASGHSQSTPPAFASQPSVPSQQTAAEAPTNVRARRELAPPTTRNIDGKPANQAAPWTSMTGSLAVVLAVFGVCVWFLKRSGAGKRRGLAKNVFEVLGRAPLAPRHQAVLLRCGERVLLVSLGPSGSNTLTEFTEVAEIHRIVAACKSGETGTFQETLQQMGAQRHPGGFVASGANLFG